MVNIYAVLLVILLRAFHDHNMRHAAGDDDEKEGEIFLPVSILLTLLRSVLGTVKLFLMSPRNNPTPSPLNFFGFVRTQNNQQLMTKTGANPKIERPRCRVTSDMLEIIPLYLPKCFVIVLNS